MAPTLKTLAHLLSNGETTSHTLTQEALARIKTNHDANHPVFLHVDEEAALATASHMDKLRRASNHPSPYAGIPISVKDIFDCVGQVTTAGSILRKPAPKAENDATVISRLKAAGFVILGRTNMTEFAYSGVGLNPHYGTPLSIYDRKTKRIPGGSSSGAAVCVAEDICTLSIGTDTGGSCRIPAAFNGITGFKPSVDRIPKTGTYPLSATLDSIGPIANNVEDCAIADSIMSQEWDGNIIPRKAQTLQLALPKELIEDGTEPYIKEVFNQNCEKLAKAGISFTEISFPEVMTIPAINSKGGLSAVEAYTHHKQALEASPEKYDQRVRSRIETGSTMLAWEFLNLLEQRNELIDQLNAHLYGFDGFYLPTVPLIPPALVEFEKDEDYARLNFMCLRNTFVGNFLNTCAISLPIHEKGDAPVGGMIMSGHGKDIPLFSVAQTLENIIENT